jgi:hypothetical protein
LLFAAVPLKKAGRRAAWIRTLGLYHHCVFPYLLDLAMGSRVLARPRQRTLARATGRILEIGFGTGRNLPHYPPACAASAIDPDTDLDRALAARIAAAGIRSTSSPQCRALAVRARSIRHRGQHADAA